MPVATAASTTTTKKYTRKEMKLKKKSIKNWIKWNKNQEIRRRRSGRRRRRRNNNNKEVYINDIKWSTNKCQALREYKRTQLLIRVFYIRLDDWSEGVMCTSFAGKLIDFIGTIWFGANVLSGVKCWKNSRKSTIIKINKDISKRRESREFVFLFFVFFCLGKVKEGKGNLQHQH